jgi:hypothetical protein
MDSTAQFCLAILTILGSGVVSAAVTFRLNANKAKREFKREKLEALFQAIHSYCKTIRTAAAPWPLVIMGRVSAEMALNEQIKLYQNSPDAIDRCTLLVALYFRELEADLDLIRQAATTLNEFTEQLAKHQSPESPKPLQQTFNSYLDRFVEKETAMKQRISEMARKFR